MEIDFGLPGNTDSVKLGDGTCGGNYPGILGITRIEVHSSMGTAVVNLQGPCRQNRSSPS